MADTFTGKLETILLVGSRSRKLSRTSSEQAADAIVLARQTPGRIDLLLTGTFTSLTEDEGTGVYSGN
jgi:hypothetical protein